MQHVISKYWQLFTLGALIVTLVVYGLLTQKPSLPTLTTTSFSPTNNSEIGVFSTFIIAYNRPPTPTETATAVISLSPPVPLKTLWKENVLFATPSASLFPATKYLLTIQLGGVQTTNIEYTTKDPNDFTLQEQGQAQTEADYLFGQQELQFQKEFPWANQLPIYTNTYYVVFDLDTNAIRIQQLTPFTDAQKNALLQDLQKKGISTENAVWVPPTSN